MDCINLNCPLTLGELRELVNIGRLSRFSDDAKITMCIDVREGDVMYDTGASYANVRSIIGDDDEITFYNYI